MGDWNSIFKKEGKVFEEPHEDMFQLAQSYKEDNVKKILDVGCGSGRHVVFFASESFEVFGFDNARSGLEHTEKWLNEVSLSAKLKNASCYEKFPYGDNQFDAIISTQVIHHAVIKDIVTCISEMERVLKPGGKIFVTVTKTEQQGRCENVEMIEPHTFVPLDGWEKGVPHYIFSEERLRDCFKNFKIKSIYTDSYDHFCLVGELK